MKIEKQRLSLIDKSLIFQLFNDPLVQRHMPLASEHFTERDYQEFIKAKEQIWQEKKKVLDPKPILLMDNS